ncbi:transporter substrate-binding domain-containing protein [Shewanella sp. 3B26]|uniref:Transporter substrate-binding domain-containing protein n=1 Tax=Shewanella zhuhaiensis TaxID=2919576 RepID=A0AAJ1BFB4_9GAMM|nr:transporter substrate-binding domain-containing protein [Shewanella zhuhaiensis]MCH4292907.1 transporter substrate-binding domain-containing protein [Shewanella zhuhaiensis]
MMRLLKSVLLSVALLLISMATQAKEQVIWVLERFEPYYILDGEYQGQGIADRLIKLFQQALPEYDHTTEYMPILRIRTALKTGQHVVCISFLKDTSLADYVQYSGVTMLVPPLELTVRREDWESKWHSAPQLSLAQLMEQGGKIGVADGRNYGKAFDVLLQDKARFAEGTYSRVGEHYAGLAKMVSLHRIDATIGYRAELAYAQKLDPKLEPLISVGATENTEFLFAYAVMPKGDWGNSFRARIDEALLRLRDTPEYRHAMTDWFGDTPRWEAEYQQRVLSGAMDPQ